MSFKYFLCINVGVTAAPKDEHDAETHEEAAHKALLQKKLQKRPAAATKASDSDSSDKDGPEPAATSKKAKPSGSKKAKPAAATVTKCKAKFPLPKITKQFMKGKTRFGVCNQVRRDALKLAQSKGHDQDDSKAFALLQFRAVAEMIGGL